MKTPSEMSTLSHELKQHVLCSINEWMDERELYDPREAQHLLTISFLQILCRGAESLYTVESQESWSKALSDISLEMIKEFREKKVSD